MGKSVTRVTDAARDANLEVEILRMSGSTRTAEKAAAAIGCDVARIGKSMIFEGALSGGLKLVILNGARRLDLDVAEDRFGEPLLRADAGRIRRETGFAIGGVAPIGHLSPIEAWMDRGLLAHDAIWVAAGAPDAMFRVAPRDLLRLTKAREFDP